MPTTPVSASSMRATIRAMLRPIGAELLEVADGVRRIAGTFVHVPRACVVGEDVEGEEAIVALRRPPLDGREQGASHAAPFARLRDGDDGKMPMALAREVIDFGLGVRNAVQSFAVELRDEQRRVLFRLG